MVSMRKSRMVHETVKAVSSTDSALDTKEGVWILLARI